MEPKGVTEWVRANWPCEHMGHEAAEHCRICGLVTDNFVIEIRKGRRVVVSDETSHAFCVDGVLYFYRDALYDLGLKPRPWGALIPRSGFPAPSPFPSREDPTFIGVRIKP